MGSHNGKNILNFYMSITSSILFFIWKRTFLHQRLHSSYGR